MTAPSATEWPLVLGITNAWPPLAAGSGRAFAALLHEYPRAVVIAPTGSEPGSGGVRVDGVLRHAGRHGGPLKIRTVLQHAEIILRPLLRVALRSPRPDVVAASQAIFSGVAALLIKRLFGIPYVVLAHGEEFAVAGRVSPARFRLLRAVARGAALVVCNSRYTRDIVERACGSPPERLPIVFPAVDPGEACSDAAGVAALRATLAPDGPLVLIAGRVDQRRKGFDRTIEAWPLVAGAVPGARLVVAGPGDDAPLRERAAELGVAGRIAFVGQVERARLMALFAACDVFTMPARDMPDGDVEGFGVVFLEAGLAGRAVVAGRTGGTADAVQDGETGLLVDGDDPGAIAAALIRLLTDPAEARRMGERGRARVLRDFDQRANADRFAEIVRRAHGGPSAAGGTRA
jgi:phosphatidyl-myo-inositol dimannoside synthase